MSDAKKTYTEDEVKAIVDDRIKEALDNKTIYTKVRNQYWKEYMVALMVGGVIIWGIFIYFIFFT